VGSDYQGNMLKRCDYLFHAKYIDQSDKFDKNLEIKTKNQQFFFLTIKL
jgi:hypothetical protein